MWDPQPGPQTSFITATWCDEVFFGGSRGGGKSDAQLGYQLFGALRHEGKSRGIMFRKTYAELEELQARAFEIFGSSGGVYKTAPSAEFPNSNCWYWDNGATVKMRYIEHERDYGRMHGHQYSHISQDEITEYASPSGYLKMMSTLRNANGVPCTIRATGNPGGIGHAWCKERFINKSPGMMPFVDPDTGFTRMFIPSSTDDNQILLNADPGYKNRIKAATQGNEALRKAWLLGDWDIVAGAFFDCWDASRHVIKPFMIPKEWKRFIGGDWGSARPFAFGWCAIVQDDYPVGNGIVLPRGCLVIYKEWYGGAVDSSGNQIFNTGVKMTAEDVGSGLAQRSIGEDISLGVLDPAAFSCDGGPSIAERIQKGAGKAFFRRADNARVSRRGSMGGWDVMRARLMGEDEQRPMLVFFNTALNCIRTIPALQHDDTNIEDVNTTGDDHCADFVRYICMSRPWAKPQEIITKPKFFNDFKANDLFGPGRNNSKKTERI